jgi:hypothetical protein
MGSERVIEREEVLAIMWALADLRADVSFVRRWLEEIDEEGNETAED